MGIQVLTDRSSQLLALEIAGELYNQTHPLLFYLLLFTLLRIRPSMIDDYLRFFEFRAEIGEARSLGCWLSKQERNVRQRGGDGELASNMLKMSSIDCNSCLSYFLFSLSFSPSISISLSLLVLIITLIKLNNKKEEKSTHLDLRCFHPPTTSQSTAASYPIQVCWSSRT